EYEITIGTPPASSLILKEAGVQKGSGNPLQDKVADLRIEQIIKIAKMKEGSLLGKNLKQKTKEIMGTCQSMGILVEGVPASDAIEKTNKGEFDKEIEAEKTELSADELKELEVEKKKLAEEIEKRRGEFVNLAKQIISSMQDKPKAQIKTKLREAKIPEMIIKELLPAEAGEGAAKEGGAAPAAGAAKPAAAPAKK
ncbi:hypothetical protein JXA85_02265, partial [Candidatus Woesearchaeota archaeon]|nr:hypothetical protein [Candidatus Woesearchaeota archaeon]